MNEGQTGGESDINGTKIWRQARVFTILVKLYPLINVLLVWKGDSTKIKGKLMPENLNE